MAKRVSMKHKRMKAPEWVFPWRGERGPMWPLIIAMALSGIAFAALVTSVRISVSPPVSRTAAKASVIRVLDDVDGRALTLMAREGGPFPSRFDPAEWQRANQPSLDLNPSARLQETPYVPAPRELSPGEPAAGGRWTSPRGPVLPLRKPAPVAGQSLDQRPPQPLLFPLSGIAAASLPHKLPPFDIPVDPAMAAESWRFLLRLDAMGGVIDSFPMTGGDKAGPSALADWLRQVSFNPDPSTANRWIAVGISFTNPAAHGTDAR